MEKENITNVNFNDPQFEKDFRTKTSLACLDINKVLYLLALCHTVILDTSEG